METILDWLKHWLPLVQGFAAIASVAGALLSWRFAMKAQRARAEMVRNLVSARAAAAIDRSVEELRRVLDECVGTDGKPDLTAFQLRIREIHRHTEDCVATLRAAREFLDSNQTMMQKTLESVAEATVDPTWGKVSAAIKTLLVTREALRVSAATREMLPIE